MEIPILFENDDVCVINKPTGVMVHEDGSNEGETIVDWFLEHYPDAKGVGEPGWGRGARLNEKFLEDTSEQKSPLSGQHRYDEPGQSPKGQELERSGVVHRLDKETSGVLVLAKNQEAFAHLKAQFHDRLTRKEYRAFVYGPVRERWGEIDRPIGRSAKDFRLRSAEHGAKGTLREAMTAWECIGTGRYENEHFSYLKLKPKTGRTHQIRVHLKAIGKPVVGDELYAAHLIKDSNNLGFDRMALHAHSLEIVLPDGEEHRFIAPLPQVFEEAAERIAEEAE